MTWRYGTLAYPNRYLCWNVSTFHKEFAHSRLPNELKKPQICQNVAKSCLSDVWSKKKSAEESFDCNGRFAILSEVRRSIGVLAYSIGLIIVYELKHFYSYLIIPRKCQRSHLLLPLFVRNQENTSGPLRLHARPTAALTWRGYGRIKKTDSQTRKSSGFCHQPQIQYHILVYFWEPIYTFCEQNLIRCYTIYKYTLSSVSAELKHWTDDLSKPNATSFSNGIVWSRVSKAFLRSKKTKPVSNPL